MANRQPNVLRDGWTNTLGGVDSGRAGNLLAKNALAFAVNATLRGGYAETRPPFVKPKLTFETDEIRLWWAQNETQGADYYAPVDKSPLLIASIGGRIFKVDVLAGFLVSELTPTGNTQTSGAFISPPIGTTITITVVDASTIKLNYPLIIGDGIYIVTGIANNIITIRNLNATAGLAIAGGTPVSYLDPNPKNRPQAWMEQADLYFVIQDGQSAAIIYDGSSVVRATKPNGVPTGTAMVFNEEIGRLCVGTPTNEVLIGDILNPVSFTETDYLAEGGAFRIPRKFGNITGACMLANQDRSNGQGAMLFHTENGITAFALPPNRALWKTLNVPVQINMPIHGSASHYSIVPANGDIFYRGKDGLRSFAMTRDQFRRWGNTPVSRELSRVTSSDDRKLLKFCSGVEFDNRILFTVSPQPGRYSAYHRGIGVLDLEMLGNMREQDEPVWDGIWTGIQPSYLVVGDFAGEERCFAFTRGSDNGVELWEILRKGDFDGDEGRITWWVESRSMDFGNPFELKNLDGFEAWIDHVVGEVDIDLKYRPDMHPCWYDWSTKHVCQKFKDCDDESDVCKTITSFRQGYRSRLAFGQPPNTDNAIDNRPTRHGYMFDARVQFTGRARLKWAMAKSNPIPEPANPQVETTET